MNRRSHVHVSRPSKPSPRAGESGLILTLILIGVLALTVCAVAWATLRGTPRDLAAPPSRLASCSLLADNAFLEGKGRLLRTLDDRLRTGATLADEERRLASGILDGATYTVTARGQSVAPGTSVLDQPITVTSSCRSPDGTTASVVVQGRALARSAFEIPFCACGDVVAGEALSAGFPDTDSADPAATARLVLAANGAIRLTSADVRGGIVAGADLVGNGMPAGGSYAGGENRMGGTARVLPTPRPCRCDDTALSRDLPDHAVSAATPLPSVAVGKGGPARGGASSPPATRGGEVGASCDRWLEGTRLEVPAGAACELGGGRLGLTRLVLGEGARVTVRAASRLDLSGDGPFEIGAAAGFETARAGDLAISSSTAADLKLGAGSLRAWVFAPRARVVLGDGARFEGALAVGHLELGRGVHLEADGQAQADAIYVADFREDDWRLEPSTPPVGSSRS
ncbi:MAG: hypothetical protein IPK07_28670 [Deltaproteobacteria bacterium]|nr:hypothetical protein [Deltaproteobacteria bacterium]